MLKFYWDDLISLSHRDVKILSRWWVWVSTEGIGQVIERDTLNPVHNCTLLDGRRNLRTGSRKPRFARFECNLPQTCLAFQSSEYVGDYLTCWISRWSCRGPESLAFTLKAFVLLMDHGTVSWDVMSNGFISVVGTSFPYQCCGFSIPFQKTTKREMYAILWLFRPGQLKPVLKHIFLQGDTTLRKRTSHAPSTPWIHAKTLLVTTCETSVSPYNRLRL